MSSKAALHSLLNVGIETGMILVPVTPAYFGRKG